MAQNDSVLMGIQNLVIHYGSIRAVDGISMDVRRDCITILLGANGSGKSTIFKGILGIQRASGGSILFRGRNINRMPTDKIVADGIALVPEGRGIISEMSVQENLELGAFHRTDNLGPAFDTVFGMFPILRDRKSQLAGTLSGGQQQMLAIARAIMAKPELIMLDEPSLGLAPIIVKSLFDIIIQLRKSGHTILLAEQNARMALKIADYGYVCEKGRIAVSGTGDELSKNDKVRRAYLGW